MDKIDKSYSLGKCDLYEQGWRLLVLFGFVFYWRIIVIIIIKPFCLEKQFGTRLNVLKDNNTNYVANYEKV